MRNVFDYMKELGSRRLGLRRSEVRVKSGRASDEYPMSTRWASDGNRWKYAVMLVMLFMLGVGQMWGADLTLSLNFNQSEGNLFSLRTSSGNDASTETSKTYGGYTYKLKAGNSCYYYSGNVSGTTYKCLLMGKTGSYIVFPAISEKKLTKVTIGISIGSSIATVAICEGNTSTTTTGGDGDNSWAKGETHSWTLTNTSANTAYSARVTSNHNIQITTIELEYTNDGGGGGCTAGVASSITAGDVVLIYYPSASKEFGGYSESGDSHWGAVHTFTTTPDGYYPFTVETGNGGTGYSFKNGSTYLAMSEDNTNRLVGSTTKNDASSWTVSFNGSNEATITNKAFTTKLLKYNSSSPRFSSYTSSAGNTHLPKIYKYCDDVKYYVTYYGNDNTSGSVPTDATGYDANDLATVLGNTGTLAKTGSTFAGWNTKADGTGTSYAAGDKITMSGSVSLYAKWNSRMDVASVGHVTITATPSGGSTIAEGSYTNVDCGKTVALSYSSVDANYTFTSWKVYKTGDENTTVTVTSNSFVMPAYPVTVSATVTPPYVYFTQCDDDACADKYCINSYKTGGNGMTCFTDQGSNVWTISNYAIPATGQTDRKDQNDFWVGYDGAWVSGKSADWHFRWIPFKNLACGTYKLGVAAQAVGTLTINAASSNSNTNYDLTFDPNGYGFCYGTDPSWQTPLAFTRQGVTNIWNTSIVNVSDVISHNYYVGLSKSGGGYVFSSDYDYNDDDEHIDGISEIQTISGMGVASDVTANPVTFRAGGLSSSDGASGMRGYFQIWTDNCNRNFYCHFVPVYTITYKSYDGSSTLYTDQVSAGESFTVRAAETGAIGWAESASQSAASGNYVVGNSYVPTGNVTLYVAMTAYTVSYTATSGTIQRDAVTISSDVVLSGNSVTLPTVTGCSLPCAKFLGWYAGDYSSASKPAFLAAGSSYEPAADVTLKALYAIVGDNYELVTNPSSLVVGSQVVFAYRDCDHDFDPNPYFLTAMSEKQLANNRDVYDFTSSKVSTNSTGTIISWVEATPDVAEFTVEAGSSNGTYAFYADKVIDSDGNAADPGYIYCASGSSNGYLRTKSDKDALGSWTITISDGEATMESGSAQTRKYLWYNPTQDVFCCYASNYDNNGGKRTSIFQRSISSYTTSPACTTYSVSTCSPSNGTISVSAATVSPGGNVTLTFTPSANYMLDAVTVTSGTASVGDPSYSSGPTSGGTVSITNIQSDITVCATFVAIPLYTVTFVDVDNSNATQTRTQASYGANVTAPSTSSSSAHDPCDNTWSFVGWAPSNTLSGETTEPTGFIAAGGTVDGAIIDGPKTYYSVYTNSSDGTTAFDIGKSGNYYLYALDGATKYYATTWANATKLYDHSSDFVTYPKSVLTLTYNSVTGKYKIHNTTIKQSDSSDKSGYFYQSINSSKDITVNEPTNYTEFTITTGTAAGSFRITYSYWSNSVLKTGNFGRSSGFQGYAAGYDVYFEPATSIYYYNASSCTDLVTMTFHPLAGGDPTWAEGHPKGEYTNVPKGTISTFPTDTYSDWTFIGWTAGQSYNDNREDAGETLNDDNASATEPTQTIYSTGGNSYNLQANVDMYPVFTKFADNDPFDMINGGNYYIYYIADGDIGTSQDAYGANNRIYVGGKDGGNNFHYTSTTHCSEAAIFTFTPLGDGTWSIYDNKHNGGSNENPKHYLGPYSSGNVQLRLYATANSNDHSIWTISSVSGNQINASCIADQQLIARSSNALTGSFANYSANSLLGANSAEYHKIYVGSCAERVYSSDPTNTPRVEIHGTVKVTATNGQMVKAVSALSVAGSNLATSTVTVASSSADFKLSTSANSGTFAQSITIPVVSNKVAPTAVYVAYNPTETIDGINNTVTVSVKDNPADPAAQAATTAGDIQGRHLPENFVIAAKTGGLWVALPSDLTGVVPQAYSIIMVDDANDPTKATYAKTTDVWNLNKVYDSDGAAQDRWGTYGTQTVFVSDVDSKCLYATTATNPSPTTGIGTYATAASYYGTNPLFYEWALNSSDLETYTLVNQNTTQTNKTLTYNPSTLKWGMYASGGSNIQEVRLLPIQNLLEDMKWDVMEWDGAKPAFSGATSTSGSIYYKIATNCIVPSGSVTSKSYTRLSGDIVKPSSDMSIASNAGKVLVLFDKSSSPTKMSTIEIPHIVTTTETSSSMGTAYDGMDVVVRSGGQITANNKARSFKTLTVYPGGKVYIPDGKEITVKQLMIRGGYSFLDNSFKFPEIYLAGTGDMAGSTNAIYDYFIDNNHFYLLTLPYDVNLTKVTDEIGYDNFSSWVQYYNGATRASGDQVSGWIDYDGTNDSYFGNAGTSGTVTDDKFEKGRGYLLAARPRRGKSVYNYTMVRDRAYAVVRFPLGNAEKISNSTYGELSTKTINVTAHGFTEGTLNSGVKANNAGWNFVGNPFMSSFGGAAAEDDLGGSSTITVGYLAKTPNEDGTNWNGNYEWKESTTRYVTMLNPISGAYSQNTITDASIAPFNAFFIQTKVSGTLTFASAGRKPLSMPALRTQEANSEIALEILLSDNTSTDNTGLLIGNAFTEDYEFGDDLAKVASENQLAIYTQTGGYDLAYNAIPEATAAQPIVLGFTAPESGSYVISLKEMASLYLLESVILKDNEEGGVETDLLIGDYEFNTPAIKQHNTRFTITIKVKHNPGVLTDIDAVSTDDLNQIGIAVGDGSITLHGVPSDAMVFVYDMTGKLLVNEMSSHERIQLRVPQGVYNIRVQTPTEGKTLRTIVH